MKIYFNELSEKFILSNIKKKKVNVITKKELDGLILEMETSLFLKFIISRKRPF